MFLYINTHIEDIDKNSMMGDNIFYTFYGFYKGNKYDLKSIDYCDDLWN